MIRLVKRYRRASGCMALAFAMGLGTVAHAEDQLQLRAPASLPVPLLSDIAATDYAEVNVSPGVTGEIELVRERYPDGKVRIERQVTLNAEGNYVNHGAWKMYSPTGDVVAEGHFNFGERNGMWTRWVGRNDAEMLNEFPYKEFKAPFMSQANFTNGKLEGEWIISDANDRKVLMISFKNGMRNGQATTWLPNGKIMSQITYQNSIPMGDLMEINKTSGELARAATYEDGHKVTTKTTYYPGSGKVKKTEIMYLAAKTVEKTPDDFWAMHAAKFGSEGEDRRHGTAKSWYANGKQESDGAYEYGKKTGTFTFWHDNGQIAVTGEYKADAAEDTWIWWHKNGQKSAVGKYENGTLIGEWRWWDEGGKLTKRQTYTGTESASAEPAQTEDASKFDISKHPVKNQWR